METKPSYRIWLFAISGFFIFWWVLSAGILFYYSDHGNEPGSESVKMPLISAKAKDEVSLKKEDVNLKEKKEEDTLSKLPPKEKDAGPKQKDKEKEQPPPPFFHAYDLYENWKENAAKVKTHYNNKQIDIRGDVFRVGEDEKLGFFIVFSVDYLSGQVALSKEISGLRCFFEDSKTAATFENGQEVTITGRLVMNSQEEITLIACKLKKK